MEAFKVVIRLVLDASLQTRCIRVILLPKSMVMRSNSANDLPGPCQR